MNISTKSRLLLNILLIFLLLSSCNKEERIDSVYSNQLITPEVSVNGINDK